MPWRVLCLRWGVSKLWTPSVGETALIAWIAVVELILSIGLMSRLWQWSAWATIVLMLVFMVAANSGLSGGVPCHCVGRWWAMGPPERVALGAALGVMASASLRVPGRGASKPGVSMTRSAVSGHSG